MVLGCRPSAPAPRSSDCGPEEEEEEEAVFSTSYGSRVCPVIHYLRLNAHACEVGG